MFYKILSVLTILAFIFFFILALMGAVVSAWYVVFFMVPTVIDTILGHMYDRT